jgi:hypothetical protein
MLSIEPCPLPPDALLASYRAAGAYTDCYCTEIPGAVTPAQYIEAFYTTNVFKLERLILRWAVSRPSTDSEAQQLAAGAIDAFSAWRVEGRTENQLLMCDMHGRTRSWFMVVPGNAQEGSFTRLYFGSAVVPVTDSRSGKRSMGWVFGALLGLHRIYSVVLLRAARNRLLARVIVPTADTTSAHDPPKV